MSWLKLDVKLAFFFKRERVKGGRVPVYMQTFEPPIKSLPRLISVRPKTLT